MIKFLSKLSVYSRLFVGILLLHLVFNIIWQSLNTAPAAWDPAAHTYLSVNIASLIKQGRFADILASSNYYPIFIHSVVALAILPLTFLPITPFVMAVIVQYFGTLFFLLTLIAIYLWIKDNFSSRSAFFSTTLFSLAPIVFAQSRYLMLDIPSVGLFFICLLLLKKSNYLQNRRITLWLFVVIACLLMTKWISIVFFFVPGIFFLSSVVSKLRKKELKFDELYVKTLLQGILILGVIVLPWYLVNFHSLLFLGRTNIVGEAGADPDQLFSVLNLRNYLDIFVFTQVTPIPAFTFLICLILSLFIKIKNKLFVLSMILVNYLIFTFISNKDARYTMFLLPFTSLLIVEVLKAKYRLGSWILIGLTGFLAVYFSLLTIRPISLEGYKIPWELPFFGTTHPIDFRDYLVQRYEEGHWPLFDVIEDLRVLNAKDSKIVINSEYRNLNASNIQAYSSIANLKRIFISTPDISLLISRYNSNRFPTQQSMVDYLKEADYLIVPKNGPGYEYIRNQEALVQIEALTQLDSIEACNKYQTVIATIGTKCKVLTGEILGSGSDVIVEGEVIHSGSGQISGPAVVECKWGCSFSTIHLPNENQEPLLTLLKEYPAGKDNLIFQLYNINK